jgi:hypothetical protein
LIRENLARALDKVAKEAEHAFLREPEVESREK